MAMLTRKIVETLGRYAIERRQHTGTGYKSAPFWVVCTLDNEGFYGWQHKTLTAARKTLEEIKS